MTNHVFSNRSLLNVLNNCLIIKRVNLITCISNYKDYSGREASFMTKLLATKRTKRKMFQDNRPTKTVQTLINDPSAPRRMPMRVFVLNKLFMTHITDILATGEASIDLIGRGLEITNVSVNKDYHLIKVYWIAKCQEDVQWLEKKLDDTSHSLRHELSQLHLMGSVPKIQFILDKKNSQLATIDALIMSCDKGDLNSPENELENEISDSSDLPTMGNSVYGLQYDRIVSKLMISVNKAKAPHRKKEQINESKVPSGVSDLSSKYSQKEAIRKFLLLQKLNNEKYKKGRDSFDINENADYCYADAIEEEINDNKK